MFRCGVGTLGCLRKIAHWGKQFCWRQKCNISHSSYILHITKYSDAIFISWTSDILSRTSVFFKRCVSLHYIVLNLEELKQMRPNFYHIHIVLQYNQIYLYWLKFLVDWILTIFFLSEFRHVVFNKRRK